MCTIVLLPVASLGGGASVLAVQMFGVFTKATFIPNTKRK